MSFRAIEPDWFCHIYNRGNRKENISWDDEDKNYYLSLFIELFKKFKEELIAFTILDNHFHLMVRVANPASISAIMRSFGIRSAKYYNKKYNTVGHLFQGKYQMKHVDSALYKVYLSKYIHLNPYKLHNVGSFEKLVKYPWSSLPYYLDESLTIEKDFKPFFKPELILDNFKNRSEYLRYLLTDDLFEELELINRPNSELKADLKTILEQYKIGDKIASLK